jgi:hypothetical protein
MTNDKMTNDKMTFRRVNLRGGGENSTFEINDDRNPSVFARQRQRDGTDSFLQSRRKIERASERAYQKARDTADLGARFDGEDGPNLELHSHAADVGAIAQVQVRHCGHHPFESGSQIWNEMNQVARSHQTILPPLQQH